jgi:hypothetical protein
MTQCTKHGYEGNGACGHCYEDDTNWQLREGPGLPPSTTAAKTFDDVQRPAHYASAKVECIEAIEAALTPEEFRGYVKGNVIKYTWRERTKEQDKALGKAAWYLNRLLESPAK